MRPKVGSGVGLGLGFGLGSTHLGRARAPPPLGRRHVECGGDRAGEAMGVAGGDLGVRVVGVGVEARSRVKVRGWD